MATDAQGPSNAATMADPADRPTPLQPPARDALPWTRLLTGIARLSRSTHFVITAALILGLTMTFVGNLVSQQIKLAAAKSAGEGAAIYMEAYLDEYVQELATSRTLSEASSRAIDKLMTDTSLNQHIVSVKIWLPDNTIAYSTSKQAEYPHAPSQPIEQAMRGEIVTRLSALEHEGDDHARSLRIPLYETYVPLREFGSGRILAVGEFYEMEHRIDSIHQAVWATIGVATLAMLALLFFIVRRGDRIIERQQIALRQQMQEQAQLHRQNALLQRRINTASHEFATVNELIHRRLGADLHDGPAQLLTLILLRLDALAKLRYREDGPSQPSDVLETIRSAAQESLQEIRNISRGLALPEINALSLEEELRLVVQRHEQRTGTTVQLTLGDLPDTVSLPYKICIYRLVQEALNNTFRHAGGKGQKVGADCSGGVLEIRIEDSGEGIGAAALPRPGRGRSRLGLVGMRYRVESLGGLFDIESAPGQGTRIRAQFDMSTPANAEDDPA